eukprot:2834719-Prymnesium_polylepis.1
MCLDSFQTRFSLLQNFTLTFTMSAAPSHCSIWERPGCPGRSTAATLPPPGLCKESPPPTKSWTLPSS